MTRTIKNKYEFMYDSVKEYCNKKNIKESNIENMRLNSVNNTITITFK